MDNPTRSLLIERARAKRKIREYFAERKVLEVDTEQLGKFSVTDPYMSALEAFNPAGKSQGFLQTSPEYAMKKLLCAQSGDIFQLDKVFRADESGPHHSCEFTMLEWYRLGWDEFQLMDEVYEIICEICGPKKRVNLTYQQAFQKYLAIDPFNIDEESLANFTKHQLGELPDKMLFDNYLTLLFATLVEPKFELDAVTFVHDFPASQASLAKTFQKDYGKVAGRFEAYCGGFELANGFNELTDAEQQLERFKKDNQIREQLNLPSIEIDMELIQWMRSGLPDCSGVALGFDRLLMLKLGKKQINQVLPAGITSETK